MLSATRRAGLVLTVLVALATGCTDPTSARTLHVVVDTDLGQDDAMALLYLLRHPDVRIEAVTVSGTGLAHCGPGVANALALLEVAGAPEIPVACGPPDPLPGTLPARAFPEDWRAATDRLHGIELPDTDRTPSSMSAPELLRSTILRADEPVRLLTLGPLTNVALALRGATELAGAVERIVVMGGAVDVPGNALENPLAEFNVWVDPVAAAEVLGSGAEIDLVPLDATNDVPVTPFFAETLAGHHVTPEADVVHELVLAQPALVDGGFSFWDPLAAAVLVDPSLATFERHRISVLEGTPRIQGWTVHDAEGAPVDVAVGADALAFETRFLNTLNGDDAVSSTRPEPFAAASISSTGCSWEPALDPSPGLGAVRVDAAPNAGAGLAVVRLLEGHTPEDLERWIASQGGVVRREPPPWVALVAFVQAGSGPLAAVPLQAGSHVVACGDAAGRVTLVTTFDVAG